MSRAPGDDGWCPECDQRLIVDHDENDEGHERDHVFCEECGWTPDSVPDLMDVLTIQHEQEDSVNEST